MSDAAIKPIMYQIRDWDEHFENSKSRERNECSWAAIPNKQDGLGYGRLINMPNGVALYGAFVAIVLVASKQCAPRRGYLTEDGKHDSPPHDAISLSIKTRIPAQIIQQALDACSSTSIGWITACNRGGQSSARRVPAECPPSASSEKAEKAENRIEVVGGHESEKRTTTATLSELPSNPTYEQMAQYLKAGHRGYSRLSEQQIISAFAAHRGTLAKAKMAEAVKELIRHYAGDADLEMAPIKRLETYLRGATMNKRHITGQQNTAPGIDARLLDIRE